MTIRSLKTVLRATIFGGVVGIVPAVARAADETRSSGDSATRAVPDHAQAEEGSGAAAATPTVEKTGGAPDHAESEARGAAGAVVPAAEQTAGTPDHDAVENRRAPDTR
jgi:hypothetical protein